MLNKFVFVSIPVQEVLYPSAAYGVLKPIVEQNNYKSELCDLNIHLNDHLTDSEFDDFYNWAAFAKSNISNELHNKVLSLLDSQLSDFEGYLAISVFSFYNARPVNMLLKHIKEQNKKYKILLGGNGCMSALPEFEQKDFGQYCLDNNLCDFVIYGEGEVALNELLKGNTDYPGINNTNFKQVDDLDSLDFPDYSDIDWSKYADPRLMVTGSRGCVRKCTFCDIELSWPKFRYRSARNIVDEIKRNYYETGITNFEFTDSLINGSVSNFNKFNELLINEKAKDPALQEISYIGQFIARPKRHMPEITYEMMYYAGCKQITTGIESFSERVRDHMKKKFSNEDIDYHFEMCGRWSIPNVLLLIVGYPTETIEDHQCNIDALYKYKKYSDAGTIFMSRWGFTMHIYDGTPISHMKDDLGIIEIDKGHEDAVYNWVSTKNPQLDLAERIRRRIEIHNVSHKLGYTMPNSRKELTTLLSISTDYVNSKKQRIPLTQT